MRRRSSAIAKLQAHQSPSSPPAQLVVRTDSPFQFAPKSPPPASSPVSPSFFSPHARARALALLLPFDHGLVDRRFPFPFRVERAAACGGWRLSELVVRGARLCGHGGGAKGGKGAAFSFFGVFCCVNFGAPTGLSFGILSEFRVSNPRDAVGDVFVNLGS